MKRSQPVRRVRVLGAAVDTVDMDRAVRICAGALNRNRVFVVVTPGLEMALRARRDPGLREDIARADLSVCDGAGLKMLNRRLYRVPGIDLLERLLPVFDSQKSCIYLIGGAPGIAEMAAKKITSVYQGIRVAGCSDGYGQLEGAREKLFASSASVAVICLGSPLQERYATALKEQSPAGRPVLALCLGGALDVLSGAKKRAPYLFRKTGTEWLWRFASEPHRIIRFIRVATGPGRGGEFRR